MFEITSLHVFEAMWKILRIHYVYLRAKVFVKLDFMIFENATFLKLMLVWYASQKKTWHFFSFFRFRWKSSHKSRAFYVWNHFFTCFRSHVKNIEDTLCLVVGKSVRKIRFHEVWKCFIFEANFGMICKPKKHDIFAVFFDLD